MKIFNDWAIANNENRDPAEIDPPELDALLARFFLGARKKDGGEYEPDSLSSIQNSIDRHLRDKKVDYSIKRDTVFSHSRRVLEAKRKALKSMGKGNKTAKAESLSQDEIKVLFEKKVLGAGNPEALLNTVWLNNGVYFGLRGRQDHTNLCWGDVTLKYTTAGKEYLEFNERNTKTRSGAHKGDYRKVAPKMFSQPENDNCPVKMYKLYRTHRPQDLNVPEARFYLRPLSGNLQSETWYSHQPAGKTRLGQMMPRMAEQGQLQGRKVNHSTRKTFATSLVQAGVTPNEVAHLGGWKNVQSVNEYSVPSVEQQEQSSSILSTVMLPDCNKLVSDKACILPSVSTHTGTVTTAASSSSSKSCSTLANCEQSCLPFTLFSGAHISGGSITINIMPPLKKLKYSHHSTSSSQEELN
ncbi:uncharacterized protein KIAA1958-like [Argopecten irradians]|uniref:uncharacterized protein KIAA1958-like n=1 Tax=Argopecten irradians TaxID=31199 RepID=UPI00371E0248